MRSMGPCLRALSNMVDKNPPESKKALAQTGRGGHEAADCPDGSPGLHGKSGLDGKGPPRLLTDPAEAAGLLSQGMVGAIPTETAYGLAASLKKEAALERIFSIKKRPRQKPLLLLISDPSMLEELSPLPLSTAAEAIIRTFWPGPVTLLLPARPGLPFEVTGGTGKVGVRISSNHMALDLVRISGFPVTATSANLSGQPPCLSPEEVMKQLSADPPDFILDGGTLPPSPPSTIVDCSGDRPVLVRAGVVTVEELLRAGIRVEPSKGPA